MVSRRRFNDRQIAALAFEFKQLAFRMRQGNRVLPVEYDSLRLNEFRFKAMFGVTSTICANGWLITVDGWRNRPTAATKERMLWCLHLLQSYDTKPNLASNVGDVDEKTFREWSWFMLEAFADRQAEVIDWKNRKINDIGNDCLVSVDDTDFMLDYGRNLKHFWDHKFKGPGLRYEFDICLRTSDIVWAFGPHLPSLYNDLQIFQMLMIHKLEPGERVEADDRYRGECPQHCKCSNGVTRHADRERLNQRRRNQHETVNERIKIFGCMSQKFSHSTAKHGACFSCVVMLTQLAIEHGSELFPIQYNDQLTDATAGL